MAQQGQAVPDEVIGRTEIEVAADTVAILCLRNVIPMPMRQRAAEVAGIMPGEFAEALQRVKQRGATPPRRVKTVAQDAGLAMVPAPDPVVDKRRAAAQRGGAATSKQPAPDATEMRCSRCAQVQPIDEFPFRADAPTRRWTVCNDCRARRSRRRYLSAGQEEAMNRAAVEFTVSDDDGLQHLSCTKCGGRLAAGDLVHGETSYEHVRCPKKKR